MGKEDASSSTDTNIEERPLKKARYVWEIKGKYHLKPNKANEEAKVDGKEPSSTDNNEDSEVQEEQMQNEEEANNNDESCNDRCCIESFLAKADSLFMDSDDEDISKNIDKSISNEIPITLVSPNPKNRDYYLRKWQARQVARAYIDNTINRVLESWIVAPNFDASDFVENCDNDGQIEDEGILMAIQSHGLQRAAAGLSFVRPDELAESTLDNFENVHNEMVNKNLGDNGTMEEEVAETPSAPAEGEGDVLNHFSVEFLNAAVCVAIKKKGLSSYKYE